VREIFAVTDNRENFLTAKISRYTVCNYNIQIGPLTAYFCCETFSF